MTEPTRETVLAECERLGVRFVDHRQAAAQHVSNLAAWSKLLGYKDYEYRVWTTLRPWIVHPIGADPRTEWKLVAHELVHWHQQPESRFKLLWWVTRYGLRQRCRWELEAPACLVSFKLGVHGHHLPTFVDDMRIFYRLTSIDRDEMISWFTRHLGPQWL